MRSPAAAGWVLYDGDCGFCVRWARFWGPVLLRRGFEMDELQADWVAETLGMTRDEVVRDVRLLTVGGVTYKGADVYLYVARRIWWAWLLGVVFSLPGLKQVIWSGYRWFAANRHCISGQCAPRG